MQVWDMCGTEKAQAWRWPSFFSEWGRWHAALVLEITSGMICRLILFRMPFLTAIFASLRWAASVFVFTVTRSRTRCIVRWSSLRTLERTRCIVEQSSLHIFWMKQRHASCICTIIVRHLSPVKNTKIWSFHKYYALFRSTRSIELWLLHVFISRES